jgi:CheY-like chemotaxis protein
MQGTQGTEEHLARQPVIRAGRAPHVLVVDDEEDFLELTELFLAGDGFRILKARSAGEALWLALRQPPDLAIVDLVVPPGDGFQILRALRAEPETAGIPVFACSAAEIQDARGILRAGFDGHFPKPVNWPGLRDVLRTLLLR